MTNRKSHTPFRLAPQSTTLDDLERLIRTLSQKRCVFPSPTHYHRQKYRPMTVVSGNIRFMPIFAGVLWRGVVKRQWVIENVDFRAFGRYVFSTLGNEAKVIIYYYLVPYAFPVTPKYMTLNELDWLFGVKFCFRAGLAGWDRATSENNCVKTNKGRHILSAVQSSAWILVSGDIRLVRTFGRVL